jgi:hypothetical protein
VLCLLPLLTANDIIYTCIARYPNCTVHTCDIHTYIHQLSLSCKDGGESTAIIAALTEVERIRVHGLSDREVNTAKRNMLTEVRSEYLERHQTDSATLCDELVEHYCKGIPAPGIKWEVSTLYMYTTYTHYHNSHEVVVHQTHAYKLMYTY